MVRQIWNEKKIERMLKDNIGTGTGSNYKPWIHAVNAPSKGFIVRPLGWKTNRIHQLLSRLEFKVFLIFEWEDSVIDIREQFPLSRDTTRRIADELGIKHPIYPSTDVEIVMTTDLLISFSTGQGKKDLAVSVKISDELDNSRVIEKLQIEKQYWEDQNIEWVIITEKNVNENFSNNLQFIHNSRSEIPNYSSKYLNSMVNKFCRGIKRSELLYLEYFDEFDMHYKCEEGFSLALFKYCLANKLINIDMHKNLDFEQKIELRGVSDVIDQKSINPA